MTAPERHTALTTVSQGQPKETVGDPIERVVIKNRRVSKIHGSKKEVPSNGKEVEIPRTPPGPRQRA